MGRGSAVLEIGCGLGRIAFPLRYVLEGSGSYDGFEIVREKVEFLTSVFTPAHPNFRFVWANVRNTYYNPDGEATAAEYRFPYDDARFDVVFAASVFTHMAPDAAARYFAESARVLRPGGRCLFSFFLLDNLRPAAERPRAFAGEAFDFAHLDPAVDGHAASFLENPEQMTAYSIARIEQLAAAAGLKLEREPLPGFWSGASSWVSAQDLVVLRRL